MSPINLGIIGLSADKSAWAAVAHYTPLISAPLSEKYSIKAVGTSRPETAKAAAAAYGIPEDKAYSNSEDIANDPDVDMVVVSVKTHLHKQLTIPALKAKKQVFVEWPLGNGLAEAEELASLAKAQGVKTIVGLQVRRTPVISKAKEIIDSGALGRIYNTTLIASSGLLHEVPAKNAYVNDPNNGANLTTIGVAHLIDPLCFLLGEFKTLNATSAIVHPTIKIDGSETVRNTADSVNISGVLKSGATASFTLNISTPATPDNFYWIISGEKGALKLEGSHAFPTMGAPTLYQYVPGEGAKWEEVEVAKSKHFGGIAEVYETFAEGKGDGLVDFDEAVKRHRLIDAVLRSSESGQRVTY